MFWKKVSADFKPHKVGLRKVLGDLEADIMEVIWHKERVSVREVYEQLLLHKELAYTTVMTIMTRLAEKGLLKKESQGNAYIYTPSLSKQEFTQTIVKEVLDGLFDEFAEPAISHLVDRISQEDDGQIDKLEALIKERRKQGGR